MLPEHSVCKACAVYFIYVMASSLPWLLGGIIVSILQMRKRGLREFKLFVQGHRAGW